MRAVLVGALTWILLPRRFGLSNSVLTKKSFYKIGSMQGLQCLYEFASLFGFIPKEVPSLLPFLFGRDGAVEFL